MQMKKSVLSLDAGWMYIMCGESNWGAVSVPNNHFITGPCQTITLSRAQYFLTFVIFKNSRFNNESIHTTYPFVLARIKLPISNDWMLWYTSQRRVETFDLHIYIMWVPNIRTFSRNISTCSVLTRLTNVKLMDNKHEILLPVLPPKSWWGGGTLRAHLQVNNMEKLYQN